MLTSVPVCLADMESQEQHQRIETKQYNRAFSVGNQIFVELKLIFSLSQNFLGGYFARRICFTENMVNISNC